MFYCIAKMAAATDFISTIEDDDIVPQEESEDSDVEQENAKRQKGSTGKKMSARKPSSKSRMMLNQSFVFSTGGSSVDISPLWDLKQTIQAELQTKGVRREGIEEKILKFRENRKRKALPVDASSLQLNSKERKKKKKLKDSSNAEEEEEEEAENGFGDSEDDDDDDDDDSLQDSSDDDEDDQIHGHGRLSASDSEINESDEEEKKDFFHTAPEMDTNVSFTDMNLSRPLLRAVNMLGYTAATPVQSRAVPLALLGRDICACAATGTGKTAAYMLPVLERLLYRPPGPRCTRVIVLVPTRELAIQVYSVAKGLAKFTKVEFCLATGGLDSKSQEAALRNQPDVVIATPGRLVDHLLNAPSFGLQTIEILILDEADRMLDEHFMEQMNEIIKLCPPTRQTMLFSATMTDNVQELVRLSLNKPVKLFVDSNIDVADNLRQEFVRIRSKTEDSRTAIVAALCRRSFQKECLVFAQTKWLCHRLRIVLGLMGLNVAELHGGLGQIQRLEALQKFKDSEVDVLIATDLAARGLDISGVKTVINYSMPSRLKQYIHRVGRTARAGRVGRSVTLVGEKGRKVLKEVVKQAKLPVKSRIVPAEVVASFQKKVQKLEPEVKLILKEEEEEKMLRQSEMSVSKAENMIEHEKEIFSRPARTWIAKEDGGLPVPAKGKQNAKGKELQHKKKTAKEAVDREVEYIGRQAKRDRKPKKIRACVETPDKSTTKKKRPTKSAAGTRTFDRELTDTSKKALKDFRRNNLDDRSSSGKSGGKFKSKKKYKRKH